MAPSCLTGSLIGLTGSTSGGVVADGRLAKVAHRTHLWKPVSNVSSFCEAQRPRLSLYKENWAFAVNIRVTTSKSCHARMVLVFDSLTANCLDLLTVHFGCSLYLLNYGPVTIKDWICPDGLFTTGMHIMHLVIDTRLATYTHRRATTIVQ